MKTIIRIMPTTLFIFFLSVTPALAVTIHVPTSQPTIQAGIDAAMDGDLVLVDPGIYVENIDFLAKSITVQSEEGADVTIIDGSHVGSAVRSINGETEATVLDGFTIRKGNADSGGGICCLNSSSPTIKNCTISQNNAESSGGGIYCLDSSPLITNCTISDNWSNLHGGGIYCSDSSPTITNSNISENKSNLHDIGEGGGIYCFNSSPTISNCMSSENQADDRGGGIYCSESSPTITNCTILGNSATHNGGGIYCKNDSSLTIANCTISRNSVIRGGAIFCHYFTSLTVTNCILWEDSAFFGPEIAIIEVSSLTISYSDVQGGEIATYVEPSSTLNWLEGNIDEDPLFVGGGDYHLSRRSPCIDAGIDAGVHKDIDGQPRPFGAEFDMGADEFWPRPCHAQIMPISHSPIILYLIPSLGLFFLSRRFFD